MVSMRHHNNDVADFEQLVKLLPPSAVASPLRLWSTFGGRRSLASLSQARLSGAAQNDSSALQYRKFLLF
jgi:hypothetical protein